VFTNAEQRALDQLSTPSGHLAVLAADQRTKLVAAREAASMPSDVATLRGFKLDLVRALAHTAPAVLLDPEIALPHVLDEHAFPARTGLLVSLERSGAVRTADGLREARLLPDLGAAGVRRLGGTGAKLLVRLRADREDADGANGRLIRAAADDCAANHLLLVVEVLVYRLDDEDESTFQAGRADTIRAAAQLAEACGARYLKLEYPGDGAACAALTAGLRAPWALLSAGVDHATFVIQLREALAAGADGFIAGRSIWKESVTMDAEARRAFLGGEARRRLEELLALVE
jgi:sulfofructosephosphate aldolase